MPILRANVLPNVMVDVHKALRHDSFRLLLVLLVLDLIDYATALHVLDRMHMSLAGVKVACA